MNVFRWLMWVETVMKLGTAIEGPDMRRYEQVNTVHWALAVNAHTETFFYVIFKCEQVLLWFWC